jgi:hypothetical protein
MDFGNACALLSRVLLLGLLAYGIVLSVTVMLSCQFLEAVSRTSDESHGVGLLTFETEGGDCVPHGTFVTENYNGMEYAARAGGYVGPAIAAVAALCLLVDCVVGAGGCGGRCVPALLILGASAGQGLTFLLFRSDLFCGNADVIRECDLGDAGYRSVQSCLVYAFCLVLHCCGPTPTPLLSSIKTTTASHAERRLPPDAAELGGEGSSPRKEKETKKRKKKKAIGPGKGEDWTREMYEQRRKERRSKSKGAGGRANEEIFDETGDSGRSNGNGKMKKKKINIKVKKTRSKSYSTNQFSF